MTPTAPAPRRGRPPSGGREEILSATLAVLRERGVAKLTTREVARRAGVSEGSIYTTSRTASACCWRCSSGACARSPTSTSAGSPGPTCATPWPGSWRRSRRSWTRRWTCFTAAQSDADLREALGAHMRDNDLGPHRGITMMGAYLKQQQRLGVVRADVDPETVAYTLVSGCYMRAYRWSVTRSVSPRASSSWRCPMMLLAPTEGGVK